MEWSGVTGSPADAMSIIQEESNFVSLSNGGRGAVEDFVSYLMKNHLGLR